MDRTQGKPGDAPRQRPPPVSSAQTDRAPPNISAASNHLRTNAPSAKVRNISSIPMLAPPNGLVTSKVVALAHKAMQNAFQSSEMAEQPGSGSTIQPGITIDLSRKNIRELPDEVVEIIKDRTERLALSHNQLSSLPARFSECSLLRYLNIRGNQIRYFPAVLCDLQSLEILDIGRNELHILPSSIVNLSSLKVLSVSKNKLRELPVCLANMVSLQVIKFEGNDITFPPKDVIFSQAPASALEGRSLYINKGEFATTARIKSFLKQHATPVANGGNQDWNADLTPNEGGALRHHPKRGFSGRFPVKVSVSDTAAIRSPVLRSPSTPSTHFRRQSQSYTDTRRSNIMPSQMSQKKERIRSISESRVDIPDDHRERSLVGWRGNASASGCHSSHLRALSYGSAIQRISMDCKDYAAPVERYVRRPTYVQRLSILPESDWDSKHLNPMIEFALGLLHSIAQIQPTVEMLETLLDGSARQSKFRGVLHDTSATLKELEREIQKHMLTDSQNDRHSSHTHTVHRACGNLIGAYKSICTMLASNVDLLVDIVDARYFRTLLILLYHCIMELRVTSSRVTNKEQSITSEHEGSTIRPYFKRFPAAPVSKRPTTPHHREAAVMGKPEHLTVSIDAANISACDPLRSTTSISLAEGFLRHSLSIIPHSVQRISISQGLLGEILSALENSADTALRILPDFLVQLQSGLQAAMKQRSSITQIKPWERVICKCAATIQRAEALKANLSQVESRESDLPEAKFWNAVLCFVVSWTKLVSEVMASFNKIPLPLDTKTRLRPVQKSMKKTASIVDKSPWRVLFRFPGSETNQEASADPPISWQNSYPLTPQTATLGPAIQSTLSMTPQSASFAAAFHGDVFDRAGALIANPGKSMSKKGESANGDSPPYKSSFGNQ